MIFFDTETTGLIKETAPLEQQPRIIEIAAVRIEATNPQKFQTLINPAILLPQEVIKITGITDEMLRDAPTFIEVLPKLVDFFLGESEVVAHNVEFDRMMLVYELRRVAWEHRFPYPRTWIDTVYLSGGKKLEDWSREVLGKEFVPQTHRAMEDVERLMQCWKRLTQEKVA